MTQDTALSLLKTGANIFLTGEPGSGKTHTINAYVSYLREHGIEPAITASTGIAATHIGGMTIHSWCGIGVKKYLTSADLDAISANERVSRRVANTQVLIIDEISMLDAHIVTAVDAIARTIKRNGAPFGGMQVVLVGDFFQLPPVTGVDEKPSQFAFLSPSWERAQFLTCYLSEQHRQDDEAFLNLLSAMRRGEIDELHIEQLQRCIDSLLDDTTSTRLYSHNANVDRINEQKLHALSGAEKRYEMVERGPSHYTASLKRSCLSPQTLALKIGARVMFTKNNFEGGYVNGTLGEVVDFTDDETPVVRLSSGKRVEVTPAEWAMNDGGKVLAKILQLPLRLAWAITIHKSQGLTLEKAVIDLSSAFEYGQGYVALSRVRSFSGLMLLGMNPRSLEVHPEVLRVDEKFRQSSRFSETVLEEMGQQECLETQKKFIIKSGGAFGEEAEKIKKKRVARSVRSKEKHEKRSTYEETLRLFNEGKAIEEIAELRAVTTGTIFSHIEKLYLDGLLSKRDIEKKVSAKLRRGVNEINRAFKEAGDGKLTPVYEALGGKYSYDELRLVRMLL